MSDFLSFRYSLPPTQKLLPFTEPSNINNIVPYRFLIALLFLYLCIITQIVINETLYGLFKPVFLCINNYGHTHLIFATENFQENKCTNS